jgi:hypothetical protein
VGGTPPVGDGGLGGGDSYSVLARGVCIKYSLIHSQGGSWYVAHECGKAKQRDNDMLICEQCWHAVPTWQVLCSCIAHLSVPSH